MSQTFSHEKLVVYQRALAFYVDADRLCRGWDSKHAIVDHLSRAAESIVENIAEASAARSAVKKRALDYSMGSALECAACLDIAEVKALIGSGETTSRKHAIAEIFKMLMGLRKSWTVGSVTEQGGSYDAGQTSPTKAHLFHHERLDVYVVALQLVRWLSKSMVSKELPSKVFRKLDGTATSIVLNIAEGNGRFSELDHRRFLEIAH